MKPTWTKVYSGAGYPLDPKREEARRGYECVMIPAPRPYDLFGEYSFLQQVQQLPRNATPDEVPPLNLNEILDEMVRLRRSRDDAHTANVIRIGIENILSPVDRAQRKRRQKEMGAMFVKYGVTK